MRTFLLVVLVGILAGTCGRLLVLLRRSRHLVEAAQSTTTVAVKGWREALLMLRESESRLQEERQVDRHRSALYAVTGIFNSSGRMN